LQEDIYKKDLLGLEVSSKFGKRLYMYACLLHSLENEEEVWKIFKENEKGGTILESLKK